MTPEAKLKREEKLNKNDKSRSYTPHSSSREKLFEDKDINRSTPDSHSRKVDVFTNEIPKEVDAFINSGTPKKRDSPQERLDSPPIKAKIMVQGHSTRFGPIKE